MPLEYDLASGSTRELNKKLHALGIANKIDKILLRTRTARMPWRLV